MSFDLNAIIGQMGKDKGITRETVVEAITAAVLSAAKRQHGHNLNLECTLNEESGDIEIAQFKTVVEEVADAETQVSLEEARAEYDPDAMIGDELGKRLETRELGRIAAQTAKQVIIQKVRDAERDVIYAEYKDLKGDIINCIVSRYEKGNLIANLGRTEGVLPKREQIIREKYRQGDRLRAMILDIDRSARGPQIILTRSHPDFLKKLFALEVPEIGDGTIDIKAVAREPGERAKIAVHTSDDTVDPVGACVGVRGSRVQAVVQELRGERIDIVTWTPDEPSFVARALAPAQVSRVVVDEEAHSMEVIVNDDQLALAIGKRGINVKLASRLSGWRLDVRSSSVAELESKRARSELEKIANIDFTQAENLYQHYRSLQEVARATPADLQEILSNTEEQAAEIIRSAGQVLEDLRLEAETKNANGDSSSNGDESKELRRLGLEDGLITKLLAAKIKTLHSIISLDDEELAQQSTLTPEEITAVRTAIETFLRGGAGKLLRQ